MEIRKVWAISRHNGECLDFYDTRDEAVIEARALARPDRETITGIFETFAGDIGNGHYDEIWSFDIPEMNSSWGINVGEAVGFDELDDIIKNGRGMD